MTKPRKVLVGGVFDILHYGHIYFLKEAKKLGDYLIIALESDANTRKLKGGIRPFHNQNQRKEILESLKFIDKVIVLPKKMTDKSYMNLVTKIRPFAIAITKGDPMKEKKSLHAATVSAKLIEIKKVNTASTTQIAKLLELE